MTFKSILLSYAGIALVAVGFSFSLMTPPSAKAMNIYSEHLPIIGIDPGLVSDSYKHWKL